VAAVEGRVEADEVYGLVLDVLAQDFEIVAVKELVFLHCGKILTPIGRLRNCQFVCVVEMPGSIPGRVARPFALFAKAGEVRSSSGMNMHSRLPPFRTERGRMGHPLLCVILDLHLERVATFHFQVSSKAMI
jgi:hypothetical protein